MARTEMFIDGIVSYDKMAEIVDYDIGGLNSDLWQT